MLISNHTRLTRASEKKTFWRMNTGFDLLLSRENIALVILSKFAYYKEFPSKVYDF